MTTLEDIHQYYTDRIDEVKKHAIVGDPWVFLLAASFIDYLVKMINNNDQTNSSHYKDFIRNYLSHINSQYFDFKYSNGKQDLPEQMYHVLRCGLIHNFSLEPDSKSKQKGGRSKSILIAHKKNGATHFTKYNQNDYDSVIFTAEDFVEDIGKVIDKIFIEISPNDQILKDNIINWVSKYPPLGEINA